MNDINGTKLAVVGGDMRMLYCAKELAARGFETALSGFDGAGADPGGAVRCRTAADALAASSAVILPVPYSTDGCRLNCPFSASETRIDDLLGLLRPSQLLLAGVCRPALVSAAEERGLDVTDYMNDEALAIYNARATAEGALSALIRELPVTLLGRRVLVTGYGRVGSAVAALLKATGCDVTVCARRRSALASAECAGCRTADIKRLCRAAAENEVIINTVPDMILDRNVLSSVPADTLIVDLASLPGGVDTEYAGKLGLRVCRELSLPGRCSPATAGARIADAVVSILERRGII